MSLLLVPCSPEDVRASVACVTGELTVTWNVSVGAENYRTSVSRGTGPPVYCNSTETRCAVGGLMCGSSYTVTVSALAGTCFSRPSADVIVQTCETGQLISLERVRDSATGLLSQIPPLSLILSTVSSHERHGRAHVRSGFRPRVVVAQRRCQVLHRYRCERRRSQVRVHHQ